MTDAYESDKDRERLRKHAEKACNQMVGRALGWEVINAIFQDAATKHPRLEGVYRSQAKRCLRR